MRGGSRSIRRVVSAPTSGPRALLVTEGTYPFIVGGVSTWCDILVRGLADVDWRVLPVTAGGVLRESLFEFPDNVRLAGHIDLWSEVLHPWHVPRRRDRFDLAATLLDGLLRWSPGPLGRDCALVHALVWCRQNPGRVKAIFRSRTGWALFVERLRTVLEEPDAEGGRNPDLDFVDTGELYRTLYWIARTAATPTPTGDHAPHVLLVTAAGWAAIPGVVHRAIHGTPLVLTEHGVYVREAYLAAIRSDAPASSRWMSTRLARGLARLAYANADVVAPVTHANAAWETALGVETERIRPIYNGVLVPIQITEPPARQPPTVVSIGRLDGLKDIKTMLRTAEAVLREVPHARFRHFGPVPVGQENYERECRALHRELELGDRFVFAGETADPYRELEQADVALLTSISEGFPISVLEAMACARPVVATAVGGVREAVVGCGFTAPPGDVSALAAGVVTLLCDPGLARLLGRRGHARAARHFGQSACLANYAALLSELSGCRVEVPELPDEPALGEVTVDDLARAQAALERHDSTSTDWAARLRELDR